MKKLWRQKHIVKGFTLVELLVVIAIIALLMALVMPAISSALLQGRITSVSANGRNIYQSIIAQQTRDIYRATVSPFPREGHAPHGTTSRDYFYHLVTNRVLNVSAGFFAAPGVEAARDIEEFRGSEEHNAWRVVSNSENIPETSPLLFTKNLDGITSLAGTADITVEQISNEVPPFQRRGLALVTRGGASYALQR